MDKKDFILTNLDMIDVLSKYNISTRGKMFKCPFHGKDKHPSAKYFDKTFYCFACGKQGDLIQFVQYYFNLDFKEAMQKINQDFSLGLDMNTPIDYDKINRIKKQRMQKQLQKDNFNKEFVRYCKKRWECQDKIDEIEKEITLKNWEDKIEEKMKYRDLLLQIDDKLDYINEKIASL